MDKLEVNSQFIRTITKDKNPNGSATIRKGFTHSTPQTSLVSNTEALLDITALSHGDDTTIFTDIKETVLLEDGSWHRLKENGW